MIRLIIASTLLLFMNITLFAIAPIPDKYPDVVDTASNFKLKVQRHYRTPFELNLIIKSEGSDAVKKFMIRLREKDKERALKMINAGHQPIKPADYPALVKDKMPHDFINLIESFKKNDFMAVKPLAITSASLDYRADIQSVGTRTLIVNGKKKILKNVFIINSNLSWQHRCGADCGLDYTVKTTVIFNAKGKLLDVETSSESIPLSMQ